MEDYVLIKDLPDAKTGTLVVWNPEINAFHYEKSVNEEERHSKFNWLSKEQVIYGTIWFCKANDYPEHYAYHNPVFSRKDVLAILKTAFPEKKLDGAYSITASKQIVAFESLLRDFGKTKAKEIMKSK